MLGIFLGPLIFFIGVALLFLLVPRKDISRFWDIGLVGGLGISFVLTYLMHNVFGFWNFVGGDIIIYGIPLCLAAVWMPLVMIYSYWVSKSSNLYQIAGVIAGFALLATAAHWYYVTQGMLIFVRWSVFYTFILAVAIHIALLYYLYASKQITGMHHS